MILSTLVLIALGNDAGAAIDWRVAARRLTGESPAVREQAIIDLGLVENFDQVVIQALETRDRSLALDAITALKRTQLLPQLLTRIPSDSDGFIVHTINALLTKENMGQIGSIYLQYIAEEKGKRTSPGALLAMLETLGRLGFQPRVSDLERLLAHPFPEVRSAVLTSARSLILRFQKKQYLGLVGAALELEPFQLRVQAASLASELPDRGQKLKHLRRCARDVHITVRGHCEQLLARVK